ncbi:MAG: hypothetical protein AABO58_04430 [Acidobacteriota bacterium]
MRTIKTAILLLLVATSASARRHAIGWPFALQPCIPGTVAFAAGVADFAVNGGFVYFGDENGVVWRVPREGATPATELVRIPTEVLWVEVDATRVYFAGLSGELTADIFSIPKGGGAMTTVASAVLTPGAFATDAQFIYWVSLGTLAGEDFLSDGAVRRVSKSGGTVQTLAGGLSLPIAITVAGGNVYYGETGIAAGNTSAGLRRVPVDGGAVTKLYDSLPVGSVAVDDTNAYFAAFRLGTGLVDIDRIPIGGGTPVVLAGSLDFADGLVVQSNNLYYVAENNETASIQAISLPNGSPRVIREVETRIARLAFDECLIYYATSAETIARSAR